MRAIAIVALALGGSPALAQDLNVYTGVAIGAFDHDNPLGGAFSATVRSWKLYAGFQLNDYFGFEIGHGSPSAIDGGASGSPLSVGVRFFPVAHRVDFTTTTFKAMGYLPVRWGALWFGYGMFLMDADADFSAGSFGRTTLAVDDEGEVAALGVDWRLGRSDRSIDLRLEYEWLDLPFADASTIAVGVAYRFGRL